MENSSTVVRILVVEDHKPFRDFLFTTLQARPEWQVIGETSDGLQAIQKAEELRPDLIVLDIALPTLDGIEAAHRISRVVPSATILFLSQNSDADVVRAALNNGARGYVLKADSGTELLPAVEAVLLGHCFVSAGIAQPAMEIP